MKLKNILIGASIGATLLLTPLQASSQNRRMEEFGWNVINGWAAEELRESTEKELQRERLKQERELQRERLNHEREMEKLKQRRSKIQELPAGAYYCNNGKEICTDERHLFEGKSNDPFEDIRKIPEHIYKTQSSDGNSMKLHLEEGYELINKDSFWEGARKIKREFIIDSFKNIGGKMRRIGDAGNYINLDNLSFCAYLKTPDSRTPITYYSINPDGEIIGETTSKPGEYRCIAEGKFSGDYIDNLNGESRYTKGTYSLIAIQGDNSTSRKIRIKRTLEQKTLE